MCWLGYRYMDRKVPDEIRVSKGSEDQVQKLLDSPFLTFDDAVAVSGGGRVICFPAAFWGLFLLRRSR